MDLRDEITEIETSIVSTQTEIRRLEARLAGLQAERDALLASAPPDVAEPAPILNLPTLRGLARTEAIERVLGAAQRPLSIREVGEALEQGGHGRSSYFVVQSTLQYLTNLNRATRVSRGLYAA